MQEHCERAPGGGSNGGFQHTLVWNVRGREFRASGIGRSKKDAKKDAVKILLVQLGPVSAQVSREAKRSPVGPLPGWDDCEFGREAWDNDMCTLGVLNLICRSMSK